MSNIDNIINKIGKNPSIQDHGLYSSYEPETIHKNTVYYATDLRKIYLNGKEYGSGTVDEEVLELIDDKLEEIKNNIYYSTSQDRYVDLGLPSGNLWMKCNLGASSETEAGKYYAFGDIEGTYPNEDDTFDDNRFSENWYNNLGLTDILDENNNLKPEYDAVCQTTDNNAHIPTFDDIKELLEETVLTLECECEDGSTDSIPCGNVLISDDDITFYWNFENEDVNYFKIFGIRFTSRINGNSIFVPAAGLGMDGQLFAVGDAGYLWSASRFDSDNAFIFYFNGGGGGVIYGDNSLGIPLRGVTKSNFFEGLKFYTKEETNNLISNIDKKVDKEDGKVLSSNDYTDEDKTKLSELPPNSLLTWLLRVLNELIEGNAYDINNKVNKVEGKGLSTEDFTTLLKEKLEDIDIEYLDTRINELNERLNIILDEDNATAVIDTFQEIENFLQGITNTETLTGLLQDLKSDIIALCNNTYIPCSDIGYQNGYIPKFINFPNNSKLVQLGYNTTELQFNDESYFKGICKWVKAEHNNKSLLIGGVSPNSYGYVNIYNYVGEGVNAEGNPSYISGMYKNNQGNIILFGYNNYNWFYKYSANTNSNVASADKLTTKHLTNEDLNNIKDDKFSNYYAAYENSVINKPTGVTSFNLTVYLVSSIYIQVLTDKYGTIYIRYYDGQWFPWKQLATTDGTVAKLSTRELLGEDLNNIKTVQFTSFYGRCGNACLNRPNGVDNFGLQVYGSSSEERYCQILTSNDGTMYKRNCFSSVWSPWKRMLSEDDFTVLTQAQYDALSTKNANTLYFIKES